LVGEEASFIVMVDGNNILPFASSQDHKARDNGDKGPNTGGMGAYSPAPVVTQAVNDWAMENVIRPTVDGMKAEGNTYTGFLYAGLMIAPDDSAKVLEYNCRFGDPETQPIMMRLRSDIVELCQLAIDGKLNEAKIDFDPRAAVGVVLAAGGYPNSYNKGDVIKGLAPATPDSKIFHAGTKTDGDNVVTNGGRVLCAVALGDNVTQAQQKAYELVKTIEWDNVFYRTDIAYRAIAREE
jgi:phosphoribosylamine--glycine ligase